MSLVSFGDTQWSILVHVALAMLLGGLIGYERETANKPAGLRTHMLVAGAAALLVGLGNVVLEYFRTDVGGQAVQSDPLRIMEAVITGISFLGAGTIIWHQKAKFVEGLTTAASLLFTAAIGMCVALSQVFLAIGVTVLVLLTLRGVGILANRVAHRE